MFHHVTKLIHSAEVDPSISQRRKVVWRKVAQKAADRDGCWGYPQVCRVVEFCWWCDENGKDWELEDPNASWEEFRQSRCHGYISEFYMGAHADT